MPEAMISYSSWLASACYVVSTASVTRIGVVAVAAITLEDDGVLVGQDDRKKHGESKNDLVHLRKKIWHVRLMRPLRAHVTGLKLVRQ